MSTILLSFEDVAFRVGLGRTLHRGSNMRERVIEAMQLDGDYRVSTWRIARRMHKPTDEVRRELLRMERDGLVCREPVSAVNNIIWRLLPIAA